MTKSDADAADIACYRPITAIGSRVAPVIAQVELETGERLSVTPDHPIWNATADGWVAVGECAIGDAVLDLTGLRQRIVAITYDATPTVVYNFEVDGTHTYYADGVWVHNQICMPRFRGRAPRNLKEKLAIDEATGGQGTQIMSGLRDPGLQGIRAGAWDKLQHVRRFSDGTKVVIHTSSCVGWAVPTIGRRSPQYGECGVQLERSTRERASDSRGRCENARAAWPRARWTPSATIGAFGRRAPQMVGMAHPTRLHL